MIEAVKDRLGGRARGGEVAREVAGKREEWLARWQPKLHSNEHPINPYRVISDFMRVVDPAEAIVTHNSGSPREQLNPFYRATRPRGYLGWGKSHQLGTGLGLAIGAKVAAPDKFCVNIMGDAAFGMTGLNFETAVRCGIPITTIVLNNSTMAIETHAIQLSHDRYRARDLGGSYANMGAIWAGGASGSKIRARLAMRSCAPAGKTTRAVPRCSNSSQARSRAFRTPRQRRVNATPKAQIFQPGAMRHRRAGEGQ